MMELGIGEVARRAGLRTSAIRYYESIALLPPPQRIGGQRRYDPAVVERLAFIQTAQRLGFSLDEIRTLFADGAATPLAARWRDLAARKVAEVDRAIAQALAMKRRLNRGLGCGCPTVDDCIDCVLTNCGDAPSPAPAIR